MYRLKSPGHGNPVPDPYWNVMKSFRVHGVPSVVQPMSILRSGNILAEGQVANYLDVFVAKGIDATPTND